MNIDVAIRFVEWGLPIAIVTWILQRRQWPLRTRVVLAVVTALVALIALYTLSAESPVTLGPEEDWYTNTPGREVVLFVLMLLGMIARYFTKAIEARRSKIEEIRKSKPKAPKPPLEFDAWEFAYPLMVSVVTFGALLSQIHEPAPSVASLTLSFQTGFFWQTVLTTQEKGS